MDAWGLTLLAVVALGCFGAAIGSFLKVVAYPVPADSPRFPLVELATGVLFAGVGWWALAAHGAWLLPAYLVFAAVSVVLALIDLNTRRLPNRIVLPALVAGTVLLALASVGAGDWWALLRAGIGAVSLFAFYLAVALLHPAGMGMGDVKLAAVIGLHLAWLGWGALIAGAFAAFVLGGAFGLLLLLLGRGSRKTAIPYGPWMLAGAWMGIFGGNEITAMYLELVGIG